MLLEPADEVAHGPDGDGVGFELVRQGKFVGNEHAVHPAVLKRLEVGAGLAVDRLHVAAVERVARKRAQVQKRDNGLFNGEHFLSPEHLFFSPWS